MDRSLQAVLAGTFTLRFSTGLTGALLGVYLAHLPEHGGIEVAAITLALLHATFYLSELVLSPLFGLLSDRLGHHRVMLFGPAFGAAAVIITGLTTHIGILGGTRLLEGASTAASVPSILGYIAAVTASSEVMRGKAAARFEAATLAGIGAGFVVAPLLFAAIGPAAFFLNALVYGVSFVIYRFGVEDHDPEERAARAAGVAGAGGSAGAAGSASGVDWRRYGTLLRTSHVWVLAPTWIAVNAAIGLWFSQSIFQFSRANPRFLDQLLMRGFSPIQISTAAVVIGAVFGVGLIYWGNRFKAMRRTTIILYGIFGGVALVLGVAAVNHGHLAPLLLLPVGLVAIGAGLFVLAGATPAALGLLADMSERFPQDRGAIMGLYSVFLGIGQIIGALIGGVAADWRGIDGLAVGTFVLLLVALIPLAQLRRDEDLLAADHDHEVGAPEATA